MTGRVCIRGCAIPGRHLVPHDVGDRCSGCLPVDAVHGAMLCVDCVKRLRRVITDAPDLCAHLRSMIDPTRSAWNFDRAKLSGRPEFAALPLNTDVVEAADETLAILTYFAELFGDEMDYTGRHTFDAGTDSETAYHEARMPAWFLLDNLDRIVNDERVEGFARAVLGPNADPEDWTIARALARWPMRERARYSKVACPECDLKMIHRKPPRHQGDEPLYECRNPKCEWRPPVKEFETWVEYFEGEAA